MLSQCPSRTILERSSWDNLVAVCIEDMFRLRGWEWSRYSGSKKCPNVCLFLKDQIGVIFWHNLPTWPVYVKNYNILWGVLVKKCEETSKTIVEAALPSFLVMTDIQFFNKSALEGYIMLSKWPNSLMLLSPVLLLPNQSGMYWRRVIFTLQQRKNPVCKEDPQVKGVRVCTLSWKLDCKRLSKEYYSQMRPILIEMCLIKKCMCGRREENQYLTELLLQQWKIKWEITS